MPLENILASFESLETTPLQIEFRTLSSRACIRADPTRRCLPLFESTPSPHAFSSIPLSLSLFGDGCSGAERNRKYKERKRLGLGPAPRGAPRISTITEERAVALAAGRVYKQRSRATGRECTSALNSSRASTGCRPITPVKADSGPAAGGALAASNDATAAQADDAVSEREDCLLRAA